MAKRTYKIVNIPRNCEMETVRHAPRPTATAVVTDSNHHFSTILTHRPRQNPGNPNGRSKVGNLRLFTLARSQLTLLRRLCSFRRRLRGFRLLLRSGFWRLLKRQVADVKHIVGNNHSYNQATLMVDRNSAICFFTLARSQLTLQRQLHG